MNTREDGTRTTSEGIRSTSGETRTGTSAGEPGGGALAVALRGLAAGRIALGAAAIVAPHAMARASGVRPSPELGYMTRIFGARAIALGLGYLTAPGPERSRWQRLALLVDALDTAHGAARLARGGLPRPTALGYTALTGAYMAIGATRLARDLS